MFKKKPPSEEEKKIPPPSPTPDETHVNIQGDQPIFPEEEKSSLEKEADSHEPTHQKEEKVSSDEEQKPSEHPHKKEGSCCCSGHHDHHHHHQHHQKSPAIELAECQERNLRLLAEMENARKRMQKEKGEMLRFAIENTILEFLPVLDNFENALKFSKQASDDVQKWAQGFEMILAQFKNILLDHGVFPFHSLGSHFNSHEHEAIHIEETNEVPDGTILEEYAPGYKTKTRTLRPAHVKVAKSPKKTESEEKKEEDVQKQPSQEEKNKNQE
jgi:molecular chaperone GrpE